MAVIGSVPPPPGTSEPRYHVEFDGDEMIVHVAYRAGLDDEAIARRVRKEQGVLAPVRVTLDDPEPRDPLTMREVWSVERELRPGVRAIFKGNPNVWTVEAQRPATDTEVARWRAKNDTHEEYIAGGGRLVVVDIRDGKGAAEVILPTSYQHRRWSSPVAWALPETDHWPVCSGCGVPWPCPDHQRELHQQWQERQERAACHRCGKTDGSQHVFHRSDGFPERRSYHTRLGACLNEAVRYANEHGWLLHDSHGWRTFRRAPDDMPRPIVQTIEYPKRHGHPAHAAVHMDHISDDDRTVPLCGAQVNVPKLTGSWDDVTCKRCKALRE